MSDPKPTGPEWSNDEIVGEIGNIWFAVHALGDLIRVLALDAPRTEALTTALADLESALPPDPNDD